MQHTLPNVLEPPVLDCSSNISNADLIVELSKYGQIQDIKDLFWESQSRFAGNKRKWKQKTAWSQAKQQYQQKSNGKKVKHKKYSHSEHNPWKDTQTRTGLEINLKLKLIKI